MPPKPNYRFERSERDRAKKAKKEEKLRERQKRAEQKDVPDAPPDDGQEQPGGDSRPGKHTVRWHAADPRNTFPATPDPAAFVSTIRPFRENRTGRDNLPWRNPAEAPIWTM